MLLFVGKLGCRCDAGVLVEKFVVPLISSAVEQMAVDKRTCADTQTPVRKASSGAVLGCVQLPNCAEMYAVPQTNLLPTLSCCVALDVPSLGLDRCSVAQNICNCFVGEPRPLQQSQTSSCVREGEGTITILRIQDAQLPKGNQKGCLARFTSLKRQCRSVKAPGI